MSEFESHVEMVRVLQGALRPEMVIQDRGIGDPVQQHLYRPDSWWKLRGRWAAIEVETQPSRNKLLQKIPKALIGLADVRAGWEPSSRKLELEPLLSAIRTEGFKMVFGIPSDKTIYLESDGFAQAMGLAKTRSFNIEIYQVDLRSRSAFPSALRHQY